MKLWCIEEGTLFGVACDRKYTLRAICQSTAFIALLSCFFIYNMLFKNYEDDEDEGIEIRRYLEHTSDHSNLHYCDDIKKADPGWITIFYAIGVLYMFLALAIVCDEFFVPALEEMSSSRRLNLSMDVAGATLMAAGGSAPELFSSLFGTFQETDIGFGTIIGSAVFNVLFVIAMCSVFAKETLELTWWPLFRDSFCYAIGLIVLTIFVGVISKEEIELWEAIVLFLLYIVYILIMWKNADIYKYLTGKELEYPSEDDDDDNGQHANGGAEEFKNEIEVVAVAPKGKNGNQSSHHDDDDEESEEEMQEQLPANGDGGGIPPAPEIKRNNSMGSGVISHGSLDTLQHALLKNYKFDFRWQGTFRAGILKLLRDPHSWAETGGVGIVAKIDGDADQVFKKIDTNGDGQIDKNELKKLFDSLGFRVRDHDLDEVFQSLDVENNGAITEQEFHRWYTSSTELVRSQARHVFDTLDTNNSGTIDKQELKALLIQLDPHITDDDVVAAIDEMYQHGSREEITFEEFAEWYEKSIIFERQKQIIEEDMQGAWESLKPPFGEGWLSWTQYIVVFPLVLVMVVTIPDVRIPGRSKWCFVAFFLSIAWIGFFSYLMVLWAEIIGNTIGIPSVIMGLTVLAAGTSVPDLLSSVIVARRGSGDMAVSSSIGSNIFDILVGLPIPWILYTAWPTTNDVVLIGSDNIFVSLFILIGMLIFVIVAVHCQGWKLTKTLGTMMIIFYFAFLVQAIVLELPFETCIKSP